MQSALLLLRGVLMWWVLASLWYPLPGVGAAKAAAAAASASPSSSKALYCALCEVVVDEVEAAIARTAEEHAHTVQTKWRIDEKRHIPYARTEHRVMEILEDELQPALQRYGAANHTERLRLLRTPEGAEEPFSPEQFEHSARLSSTLSALYERMIDSHLEDMMLLFHRAEPHTKERLCVRKVKACSKGTAFDAVQPPERVRRTVGAAAADSSRAEAEAEVEAVPTPAEAVGVPAPPTGPASAEAIEHTEL